MMRHTRSPRPGRPVEVPHAARFAAALAAWLPLGALAAGCGPGEPAAPGQHAAVALTAAAAITSAGASNDDANVTYRAAYGGSGQFFRVYIDADRTAATGFGTRGVGADYLLENQNLYRYSGTGGAWSWSPLKAVTYANSAGVVTWTVARADIKETAACTEMADLLFDVDDAAAPPVTELYTPAATCGGQAPAAISNPVLSSDATGAGYAFSYAGALQFFRVYIDADQSAATGFAAGGGIGADYLLENGSLYRHGGGGWNWGFVSAATFAASGGQARWSVARASIGETRLCGEASALVLQVQDSALHTTGALAMAFADDASCAAGAGTPPLPPPPPPPPATSPLGSGAIRYVFVVAMENEPAAAIYGSSHAPYINGQLVPRYARATAFADPLPDGIPSEPHYVWMEAGTNTFSDVTFTGDADPSAANSTGSTAHLAAQMLAASPPVSWLSFQEGLNDATGACPIHSSGFYAPKHDPFVFFRDIVGSPPSATNPLCVAHHQPYTGAAFAQSLSAGTVAQYNFITPNACNDMHGAPGCPGADAILAGDQWLQQNLPPIIAFAQANAGVIFVVWDEPVGGSALMPFLAIGPQVKVGYASPVAFTHSSLTKSIEEIFHLPALATVAGANDLADLFQP